MNQTKELLLKIRTAVSEGGLPVERVPVEDMKQCVYTELQVNRSTFTEQQYAEVLERFEQMCSGISDGETDLSKLLLLIDALLLCMDMVSQAVYTLANKDYWCYKHSQELDDPEVTEIIEYIDREGRIDLISYDFVKEYQKLPVMVYLDENLGMRYVPYKGRRMFFPRGWDEGRIIEYYRSVILEQDVRSPHCYDYVNYGVQKGDVVVDAGAAEGIFALDCVDQAGKLYLIEADPEWVEALERTFYEDCDKVEIIYGFLDNYHDGVHVSLDKLLEGEEINYIKMDIEGAEKSALAGAARILESSANIRCAICSYHCKEDERDIRGILDNHGFVTDTSKGYMCPDWTMEAYLDAELRRGIVFGRKERAMSDGQINDIASEKRSIEKRNIEKRNIEERCIEKSGGVKNAEEDGHRSGDEKNITPNEQYDALIVVTPKDYERVRNQYHRLAADLPARRIFFVGNEEVGALVAASGLGEKVGFIDENTILPFAEVHKVMKHVMESILQGQELPRGITGWYYQQFIKMQYARMCEDDYYLIWDGDTIPCGTFSMFHEKSGAPYLDVKGEYHEKYFETMAKLIPGMHKCIEQSFISEHMLFHCDITRRLLQDIEANDNIPGTVFWEKIIYSIDVNDLQSNSFSEFETYGTYVAMKYPDVYRLRNWHSFRYGGVFYSLDTISDSDYEWLGKDFFAISFEKGDFVREDQKNLFDNKEYQKKLSARQMLEIAQEEFKEGSYLEVWER